MRFSILTLYPEAFGDFFREGLMGKAIKNNLIEREIYNLREYGLGKYHQVDDTLYGGGPGMLLRYDVLSDAMEKIQKKMNVKARVILMSPRGSRLNQKKLKILSEEPFLCIVCSAFEGVDERFTKEYVDEEISIGDYVLNRGEIPAMVLMEGLSRLKEGYMGDDSSTEDESFSEKEGLVLLEEDHYTKPSSFRGSDVPSILEKGHHAQVEAWKEDNRLIKTFLRRSDLFFNLKLKKKEIKTLEDFVFSRK